MKPRITLADLEAKLLELNQLKGTPTECVVDGVWQLGNYHLSKAYGAVAVHRVYSAEGATQCIVDYSTKREVHAELHALINRARNQS